LFIRIRVLFRWARITAAASELLQFFLEFLSLLVDGELWVVRAEILLMIITLTFVEEDVQKVVLAMVDLFTWVC
jgi:hypothetical protein